MLELYRECPMPEHQMINNLNLFTNRQSLTRVIFMYELYKKIIGLHGNVLEFGVRWGQDMALFESFRGMLEPFNYTRKIIGFDTFEGFPSVSKHDMKATVGDMAVTKNYHNYLQKVLDEHERGNPINQIQKYRLIKGDAMQTCKQYLQDHPETCIALAYFDFDIYEPTKICLELCRDHLMKGSIIAFDEANNENWPGETIAIKEVLGIRNIKLERFSFCPTMSYMVVE